MKGGIMRRTSMILAETGERIHAPSPGRRVTFGTPASNESSPLLGDPQTPLYENPTKPNRTPPEGNSWQTDSFKCALAYTLASLFVLTPLHDLFGNFSSKHQISTVSIYFHPARTVGAMIQACGYVLYALIYGIVVGFLSMLAAHLLYDLEWFGAGSDILVFLFCGIAFSLLAYTKIKISNPTFDTACTVAIIFTVTIVIKEDNIQHGILSTRQLFTYLALVLTGTCLSAMVCFLVKPAYATLSLVAALMRLMDDINIQCMHIFKAFYAGKSVGGPEYQATHARMVKTIISVNAELAHSRFELLASGQRARYVSMEKIVNSHLHLVRLIGGLAHTTEVLSTLLHHDPRVDGLFEQFVQELGPPVHSFATTLKDIMQHLPFDHKAEVVFNPIYLRSLKAALQLYSEARERALYKVYRKNKNSFTDLNDSTTTDDEAVIATCGNLSYLLEEVGDELYNMLTLLVDYEKESEQYKFSLLKLDWRFLATLPLMPLMPGRFKPTRKSKPFSKVTEALYPKKKVQVTSYRLRIWKVLQTWHQYEVRFAFKVGFGSVALSIPAFNDALRPTFRKWKGEWALIIYLIMMNRDLGAMTITIWPRLWGTAIGAFAAIAVWYLLDPGVYTLTLVAGTLSLFAFHFILGSDRKRSSLGRFSLIAYNLVSLGNYTKQNLGIIDPDESLDALLSMAFHRVVAVSVGVVWALLVTVCVFPDSARAAFRRNMCTQWMRMGIVWKANPLATLPRRDPLKPAEFQGICGEEELQQGMIALRVRLTNACNEFRLKGQFDPSSFEVLLDRTQAILNAYYSLGVIVSKSPTATSKELELIAATRQEIDELCSMLFLYFYTASSSLRMGFPVPPQLPRPQRTLHRMLRILQTHRKQVLDLPHEDADFEDFVLFYSYILITITITDQLTVINDVLGRMYGDLDETVFSYT